MAITRYVIAKMGEKYVQPPTLDYNAIYRQSSNMTPIVFVLSPGADPAFDVFKLGDCSKQLHLTCLGAVHSMSYVFMCCVPECLWCMWLMSSEGG